MAVVSGVHASPDDGRVVLREKISPPSALMFKFWASSCQRGRIGFLPIRCAAQTTSQAAADSDDDLFVICLVQACTIVIVALYSMGTANQIRMERRK